MINKTILVGRITNDLELRTTSSGANYVRFTLAVNRVTKKEDGTLEADFISCVAWRNQAENLCKFMKKGSLIGVEGRIQTGSYEKNKTRVYTTDIIAENIVYLDFKQLNSSNGINTPNSTQNAFKNQNTQYQNKQEQQQFHFNDEDLPF
jgi:single-strand DNA-binding protein